MQNSTNAANYCHRDSHLWCQVLEMKKLQDRWNSMQWNRKLTKLHRLEQKEYDQMKDLIRHNIQTFNTNKELCTTVCHSVINRSQIYILGDEKPFEPLL
jgi:hypothetical protein